MDLKEFIKNVQTEKKIQTLNEEATKQSIILPILQLLGWQIFNADEVYPEFSIENTRVDYALRNGSINKVFIEVKRINEELEKHQEQLLTYSFRQGVSLSILTNGILWWFYLPLQEGSWEQRKFYTIDMYSQEYMKIAEIFDNFLAKEKVFSGEAIENAKKLYGNRQKKEIIKRNIPKAWRKIHIEGDELLLELIAETTEKICGHRPENNEVSEFLYSIANQEVPKEAIKNRSSKKDTFEYNIENNTRRDGDLYSLNDNFTYKKITGFVFLNENITATSWKQLLVRFIGKINSLHSNEFDKISNVSGKKRPYFTKNSNELRSPVKILNSEYYVETNLSANNIVSILKEVLRTFNYEQTDIRIKLSN